MLIAVADRKINKFIQNVSGVVKRTERDKYFVVFEQKYLDKIKENKFSILDEIKTINLGNSMHMTLSISLELMEIRIRKTMKQPVQVWIWH